MMTLKLPLLAPLLGFALLAGCVAPTGPVEVTRFHVPDAPQLGHGTIAIEAAPGMDGQSLELRTYAAAVARELQRLGYDENAPGSGDQVALVRVSRQTSQPQRSASPVSVGLGGGTGSYGSGIGLGIGVNLSGPPPQTVATELAVTIQDRKAAKVLWEGRASFTVRANSPLADTPLGAARLASALFSGFPGQSGETILVK